MAPASQRIGQPARAAPDRSTSRVFGALSRNRAAILGAVIVVAVTVVAAVAPVIAPYEPSEQNLYERLKPPMWRGQSGRAYVLGSDHLGRDLLSRLIFGARVSLLVGVVGALLSGVVGVVLGGVAGYRGGRTDELIMGLADVQLAFPSILLALAAVAVLGPGLTNVILVFALTTWVQYARTLRGSILTIRERQFVLAAQALGVGRFTTFYRHVLPNALVPLVVIGSFQMATLITQEAALSFLGVGVPAATPSWGNMMADGREYLQTAWWLATLPGVALMLVVLGINFLGDGLRNAIDPLLRNS